LIIKIQAYFQATHDYLVQPDMEEIFPFPSWHLLIKNNLTKILLLHNKNTISKSMGCYIGALNFLFSDYDTVVILQPAKNLLLL